MKSAFLCTLITITICISACNRNLNSAPGSEPPIDEKIGQMLMVGFNGFEAADTSHVIRDIREYHIGGIILFDYDVPTRTPRRNIESPDQVKKLISDLQSISERPLFIAVDQEGGRVARLKTDRGFLPHVSAQYLGNLNNPDSTRHYVSAMAGQLQELGFNVNFAPVVDLNTNPQNPVIGQLDRSFSSDPDLVTEHASIYLEEFQKNNILGVLKHFPGHGSAWNDSHVGMADVSDTWDDIELQPYNNLASSGLPFAVMTAHVFNEHLDADLPATLSSHVQTEILREQLEFDGVLFSDDMQMDAIRSFYGLEFAIEKAILAGVDVLVFANNSVYWPEIVPQAVTIIKELLEDGVITEERIDESYRRIMAEKRRLFTVN
ncbi:MAG: glycoside hydrolase family 3 protein [Balneolaceae bacterium]|nr:MAG: glycoside hydrolase family 3 protein [Balneolaceae bacterium]